MLAIIVTISFCRDAQTMRQQSAPFRLSEVSEAHNLESLRERQRGGGLELTICLHNLILSYD